MLCIKENLIVFEYKRSMIKLEKWKDLARQYQGFTIVVIAEIIVLLVMIAASLGKPATYVLDKSNLIVKDTAVTTNTDGSFFITGRNDTEPFGRWIISSEKLKLPHGMYELTVHYNSVLYDMENGGGNCDDMTGDITLVSADDSFGYQYNKIVLYDSYSSMTDRVWVQSFTGIDDLEVKVTFYGVGDLQISDITINELPIWRLTCILAWILIFVFVDFIYIYFFTANSYQNKVVVAGLIAIIFASSLPLFANFLFWGHDMNFHLARIWSLADGLKNGHWIVPIQTEMINGYGYATPLFYSQLFLYPPAILYCMGAPLQVCYQFYAVVINAVTCFICYYCVKQLLKDKYLALFGAMIYTLSAYRIANTYVRAAIGEYTAMAFFPLVLYGFAKVFMEKNENLRGGGYFSLALGLSGLIQCHILSCELSAFFILLLCMICIKKTLQPKRFLTLAKAALLTVGINIGFLLPFLQSMQMNIAVNQDKINEIQEHGTYILQVLGIFMSATGDSKKGMTYEMPIALGIALILGLGTFLACCVKKYEWKIDKSPLMRVGAVCAGFTIACVIFSLRCFPWDSLRNIHEGVAKIFCMIQFPWRYLSLGTVFGVFASLIGIYYLQNPVWKKVVCGVMALLTVLNMGHFYVVYGNEVQTTTVYGILDKNDYISSGEYLPANTVGGYMNWRKIVTDESAVTVEDYNYTDGITTFLCTNTADKPKTVEIPLLNYDNYHAYALADGQELEIQNGENNYVNVVVAPHYTGMVQVKYEIPLLWKVSYAVSAIVLIGMAVWGIYHKRKNRKENNKIEQDNDSDKNNNSDNSDSKVTAKTAL